jgi:LysM repeat protein/predicted nucleic acid-binding Zn ribbon protein
MASMAQEQLSRLSAERRCPNCGTRVARDAESCFMCGHDLRIQPRRRQRISWVDALLVLAVLAVLVIWWRLGARSPQEMTETVNNRTILPTNVPLLDDAPTATPPPPTPTPPPPTPEQTLITHQVRRGETLLSIALQYGVTVEEIQAANNVQGELIRAGDELTIPVLGQPSATNAASAPGATRFEYIVRPNDTIISIALSFGSTVDAILAANSLAVNAIIRPGDRLVIPVGAVPAEVIESSATAPAPESAPITDVPSPSEIIYIAPRLIGPPDKATLPRSDSVLLRWVSVDVLQPNEWYVVLLYPSEAAAPIPSIWTKLTSHRLDVELAPEAGRSVTYIWQVSVVRVQTGAQGQLTLEPASQPSDSRQFTWQ